MSVIANLRVAAGKVASDVTDFVTRVDLADLNVSWWTDTTLDLGNVRVKQAGTVIPFDIVVFDRTARTGVMYFSDNLATASDNLFTVETVDGATAIPVGDPNGRNDCWSDYEVVHDFWSLANRTGKTVDAVLEGTASIGSGVLNCGTAAGNAKTTGVALFTTWTMGAWANLTDVTANQGVLSYTQDITANTSRASLLWRGSTSWQIWNSTDVFLSSGQTTDPVRMHHTQTTTTNRKVWTAGILRGTDTTVVQRPAGAGQCLFTGAEDASYAERFKGTIARAYLRDGELSADWLAAENASWENTGFYTIDSYGSLTTGSITLSGTVAGEAAATATGFLVLGGTATGVRGGIPAPDISCCQPVYTRRRAA